MKLSKELGLMLYWGEGDKTKNYFVALTNTNPNILVYFLSWLRKYFQLDEKRIRGRLYLWRNINESEAKLFWSKKLDVPLDQFTKSYISKSTPKIKKNRHENGVCRISYGSKEIMSEIKQGIEKNFVI